MARAGLGSVAEALRAEGVDDLQTLAKMTEAEVDALARDLGLKVGFAVKLKGLRAEAVARKRLELLVGGERRERPWRQGSVVLFDDSFEHEVRHGGDARRVVLDLSVPHPDLGRDAPMYRDEF